MSKKKKLANFIQSFHEKFETHFYKYILKKSFRTIQNTEKDFSDSFQKFNK